MTPKEMAARIAELEAQLAKKTPSGSIKVSVKGAVSYYGLGRFPVTLYGEQWKSLSEVMPKILQFCKDNADKLSVKAAKNDATPVAAVKA